VRVFQVRASGRANSFRPTLGSSSPRCSTWGALAAAASRSRRTRTTTIDRDGGRHRGRPSCTHTGGTAPSGCRHEPGLGVRSRPRAAWLLRGACNGRLGATRTIGNRPGGAGSPSSPTPSAIRRAACASRWTRGTGALPRLLDGGSTPPGVRSPCTGRAVWCGGGGRGSGVPVEPRRPSADEQVASTGGFCPALAFDGGGQTLALRHEARGRVPDGNAAGTPASGASADGRGKAPGCASRTSGSWTGRRPASTSRTPRRSGERPPACSVPNPKARAKAVGTGRPRGVSRTVDGARPEGGSLSWLEVGSGRACSGLPIRPDGSAGARKEGWRGACRASDRRGNSRSGTGRACF